MPALIDNEVEELASSLEGKMVVSIDNINWVEAGKSLEWLVLLRLASGRPLHKKSMEEVLNKIWKVSSPSTVQKVDRSTILVIFKTMEDQGRVLSGGPWSFDGNTILL